MKREPRALPVMKINPEDKDIDNFKFEDFELIGYDPHPAIKAEIANIGGYTEKKLPKCADYEKTDN
jgi:hypothetical protein